MDTRPISDVLSLIFQVLMLVLPVAVALITWFVRTYVRSASAEKTMAAVIRVSNAAIDFAEDLDQRGELAKYLKLWNVPDEVVNLTSDGLKKLHLAGQWAESEFARLGIKMTSEEAQAWIAAEFQKRQGTIGEGQGAAVLAEDAASLLRTLEQDGLIKLPADAAQATLLAGKLADWAASRSNQPPAVGGSGEMNARLQPQPGKLAGAPASLDRGVDLAQLAAQSVQYVQQLKTKHQLTLPEADIAAAWVLTEITNQGQAATYDQISRAVAAAFQVQPEQGKERSSHGD